jgi:cytochrome c-type biogenesis protein CcmH
MIGRLFLLLSLLVATPALAAVSPDEMLQDPALEARARDLAKELRCLVCQNQSIDDSDADLARDLRHLVREQLKTGATDREIKDYLVRRYGDFVLLEPPMKTETYLLWFGPFAILAVGGAVVAGFVRKRRRGTTEPQELNPDERAEVNALLGDQARSGQS